jgi:hypothetical protein
MEVSVRLSLPVLAAAFKIEALPTLTGASRAVTNARVRP